VYQTCSIVDLKGLSKKQLTKQSYRFLKFMAKIDQDNYPESMGKLFLVNVPLVFKVVWKLVSPWLHENTRKKIEVLRGSDYSKVLLQHVDKENLPKFLGGSCECKNGCMHGSDEEVEFREYLATGSVDGEELCVQWNAKQAELEAATAKAKAGGSGAATTPTRTASASTSKPGSATSPPSSPSGKEASDKKEDEDTEKELEDAEKELEAVNLKDGEEIGDDDVIIA